MSLASLKSSHPPLSPASRTLMILPSCSLDPLTPPAFLLNPSKSSHSKTLSPVYTSTLSSLLAHTFPLPTKAPSFFYTQASTSFLQSSRYARLGYLPHLTTITCRRLHTSTTPFSTPPHAPSHDTS